MMTMMKIRPLLALSMLLFCLPFAGTYWMVLQDAELGAQDLFDVAEVKALFLVCYVLLAILAARQLLYRDKWALLIVTLGMIHLGVQGFYIDEIYTYDRGAHVRTVAYIAEHGTLQPITMDYNEAHQPPLYYVTSAMIVWVTELLGYYSFAPLNFINFLYFSLFLIYGAKLTGHLVSALSLRYALTAGFMFWPGHLMHSIRISNDMLLYLIMTMFLYYGLRWYRYKEQRDFTYALLLIAVCFLTKLSAILLLQIGALILLFRFLQDKTVGRFNHELPALKTVSLLVIGIIMCAGVPLGRTAYYHHHDEKLSLLFGSSEKETTRKRRSPIKAVQHFSFNYVKYAANPMRMDRNFWNKYMTTHMFGEARRFPYKYKHLAPILGFCFLIVVINGFIQLYYQFIIRQSSNYYPLLLFSFCACIAATLTGLRLLESSSGWGDIRHAYPAVLLLLLMQAMLTQHDIGDGERKRLYYVNAGLFILLMVMASIYTMLQLF